MAGATDRRPWVGPVVLLYPCAEWTGRRNRGGYGLTRACGKPLLAHRQAWAIAFGPIPDGLCVLHRCDNPPCCEPTHLFLGTRADNMRDMALKGRHWKASNDHCPSGHAYDETNTRIYRGIRYCRACEKAKHRAIRAARGALPHSRFRTECPRGHPYDQSNTHINPRGARECRECRRRFWSKPRV